jgi:hypothetical protein
MKHLKRFNEDMDNHQQVFKEELRDFCETNLAYLLDDAELRIVESPGGWSELHLIRILLNEPKRWVEIKDHMIPFLTRLDNKYEISNQPFRNLDTWTARKDPSKVENIRLYITFDDNNRPDTHELYPQSSYMTGQIKNLIADNIGSPNAKISDIRLYVKGYKTEKKSILTKIKSFFK